MGISGILIRGPVFRSGQFKGPWMGGQARTVKGALFRVPFLVPGAAKGPWMGLSARGDEGPKSAKIGDFHLKC